MQRISFASFHIWTAFLIGVIIANILWGSIGLYRLLTTNNSDDYSGVTSFYMKYGVFLSCSYGVMFFIAFPKKYTDSLDYLISEKALIIPKIMVVSSGMYLINTFALLVGYISAYTKATDYTTGFLGFVCNMTFLGCWISTNICCMHLLFLLKEREDYLIEEYMDEQPFIQIELIQILGSSHSV